ncbi:MAG TPA: GyrI-like domain-containing protein [Longimicrobium sp.]
MSLQPVRFEQGRPMLLAGLRRQHTFADAARGIAAQWRELREGPPVPHRQGGVAYGVLCGGDPAAQVMEYMCAVEVSEFDAAHAGRMRVPPQRYAVFEHAGPAAALQATWLAIWNEWLPRSGYGMANGPEFEVYDERFDPRTGTGVVEVWTSIVPAG